jgi:hypothetical protein
MIYLKSLATGILTATLAVIVWILINVLILSLSVAAVNEGSGGVGFIVMSHQIFWAAFVGFLIGFVWRFRRLKARRSASYS